jgi:hypothetical protein
MRRSYYISRSPAKSPDRVPASRSSRLKGETFLVISGTYSQWPNLTPHIEAIRIDALSKNRVRDLFVGAEEEIT